jgi:hypothetical protein
LLHPLLPAGIQQIGKAGLLVFGSVYFPRLPRPDVAAHIRSYSIIVIR